jgi:hypothetical protein
MLQFTTRSTMGALKMSRQMEVRASGVEIEFEIEDAHGNPARFQLARRQTAMLILRAHEEMRNLPPLQGELHQETQPPFLRGRPAIELLIAESGDIVLAFRLDPFPTIQYLIDDHIASMLASDLAGIIDTPRSERGKI